MIDAHIHLQDIDADKREEFLARLIGKNFSFLFCNGTSPRDWPEIMSIAGRVGSVRPFIGVHPWFVDDLPLDWEADFNHFLKHGNCGVGEIGLDRTPKGGNFEIQKTVFVRQLDTAILLRRAFVMHCVKAWEPMLAILRSYDFQGLPFLVHSFIGPIEILTELLEMGARISLSPRSFAHESAESVCRKVPGNRLFLETDFPYLPGHDKAAVGFQDYAAAITMVYERAARLRNISVENLSRQVLDNANEIMKYI